MSIGMLKEFLLWCLVVNYGVLLVWFVVFVFGRSWLFGLHTRWFKLAPESFDVAHYSGMAIYKIGILLFNLAPFAALCFTAHGS
ncbi:DUF6868 family protein [Lysobacter niastensis]|uniref:DUF6868 domain-containing protein n=1 Tax=Lysobacter niastensis TaxID=380629 RepID=A0ABS0B5N9_9GAMM|nr:hypothetical protein [Lysobacter niastensis]MBF6023418.1 hypothetical protein [Lysobacter niastensis]